MPAKLSPSRQLRIGPRLAPSRLAGIRAQTDRFTSSLHRRAQSRGLQVHGLREETRRIPLLAIEALGQACAVRRREGPQAIIAPPGATSGPGACRMTPSCGSHASFHAAERLSDGATARGYSRRQLLLAQCRPGVCAHRTRTGCPGTPEGEEDTSDRCASMLPPCRLWRPLRRKTARRLQ